MGKECVEAFLNHKKEESGQIIKALNAPVVCGDKVIGIVSGFNNREYILKIWDRCVEEEIREDGSLASIHIG